MAASNAALTVKPDLLLFDAHHCAATTCPQIYVHVACHFEYTLVS